MYLEATADARIWTSNTPSQMGASGISTLPLVALVGGHRTSGFLFSLHSWCLRESNLGPLQPLLSMFYATAASAPPSASPVGTTTSPGKNIDLEAVADARICTSNSIIIRKRYINTE